MVEDSIIISLIDHGIDTQGGGDNVTVINSEIISDFDAVRLAGGSDTLTLGTGADLTGRINCGSGSDTIIFTMAVPESRRAFISAQLATATLPDGSITINGLFYECYFRNSGVYGY